MIMKKLKDTDCLEDLDFPVKGSTIWKTMSKKHYEMLYEFTGKARS